MEWYPINIELKWTNEIREIPKQQQKKGTCIDSTVFTTTMRCMCACVCLCMTCSVKSVIINLFIESTKTKITSFDQCLCLKWQNIWMKNNVIYVALFYFLACRCSFLYRLRLFFRVCIWNVVYNKLRRILLISMKNLRATSIIS